SEVMQTHVSNDPDHGEDLPVAEFHVAFQRVRAVGPKTAGEAFTQNDLESRIERIEQTSRTQRHLHGAKVVGSRHPPESLNSGTAFECRLNRVAPTKGRLLNRYDRNAVVTSAHGYAARETGRDDTGQTF